MEEKNNNENSLDLLKEDLLGVKNNTRKPKSIIKTPVKNKPKTPVRIKNIEENFFEKNTLTLTLKTSPLRKKEKFKIETPTRPKKISNIENLIDIDEYLIKYRYNSLKYLYDKANDILLSCLAFDPNGQIIFIKINKKYKLREENEKEVINVFFIEKELEYSSYKNILSESLLGEHMGLVFFNGKDYNFLIKDNRGDLINTCYSSIIEVEILQKIPEVYLIISIDDISHEPVEILKDTTMGYKIIQHRQMMMNKKILTDIFESANKLNEKMYEFKKKYEKYIGMLKDDWEVFGALSNDCYSKYIEEKLDEEGAKKFNLISTNMYLRFQLFNDQINSIINMEEVSEQLDEISKDLYNLNNKIDKKYDKYAGKYLTTDQIELMNA